MWVIFCCCGVLQDEVREAAAVRRESPGTLHVWLHTIYGWKDSEKEAHLHRAKARTVAARQFDSRGAKVTGIGEEEVGAEVEDWRGIGGRGDKYELHNGTKVRFLGFLGCSFLI